MRRRGNAPVSPARALVAPASLKGVLVGARRGRGGCRRLRARRASTRTSARSRTAGEGTADALWSVLRRGLARGVGRPIRSAGRVVARWLELPDGTAVVEAAEAIGLGLVAPEERDPLRASSRGLGELILADGAGGRCSSCLGGTATVDGGGGLREVRAVAAAPGRASPATSTRRCSTPRGCSRRRRAPTTPRWRSSRRGSRRTTELAPYAELPGAGAAGGLGAALAVARRRARARSGARARHGRLRRPPRRRRRSSSPARARSTGRRGRGRRRPRWRAGPRPRGVACVVFGGIVVEPLPGAETVALSGDPARARDDLRELGLRLGARLLDAAR